MDKNFIRLNIRLNVRLNVPDRICMGHGIRPTLVKDLRIACLSLTFVRLVIARFTNCLWSALPSIFLLIATSDARANRRGFGVRASFKAVGILNSIFPNMFSVIENTSWRQRNDNNELEPKELLPEPIVASCINFIPHLSHIDIGTPS